MRAHLPAQEVLRLAAPLAVSGEACGLKSATPREVVGAQIDTPHGRSQPRRLRSVCPGEKPSDGLERLAEGMRLELPFFRF